MNAETEQLRWVQADLVEEADPLVEDIRFNIEAETRAGNGEKALVEQQKGEALLAALAQANLATGLLNRLVGVGSVQEADETNAFLGDSADELAARVKALAAWPDSITLRQLAEHILANANSSTGVPNRKRTEMREAAKLAGLAQENRRLVDALGREIENEVRRIETSSGEAAQRAGAAIDTGSKLLAAIALLAVVMAVSIGYFYVYRNLLARIHLRFARRTDAKLELVDLRSAVTNALGLLEHRFDEDHTELALSMPDAAVAIRAEPIRLEQVIVNLVANALDAVKHADTRKVSVDVEPTADGAQLVVGDTGPGIASDDVQAVFDPFFTTKPAGSGLGLGLSITYNIVKDFDGDISVLESSPSGTRFRVVFKGAPQ